MCRRFRILVIGKANCGKTTILRKMCNSTDGTCTIRYPSGREVTSTLVPTELRGRSQIDAEITYPTNAGFVFHDSNGFEAGSATEISTVKSFIADRAAKADLKDQLHAIWICLPMDNDRPLSKEEMKFFEEGTGAVSVIAIFTKLDGLDGKKFGELRNMDVMRREAKMQAPVLSDSFVTKHYLEQVKATAFSPSGHVYLRNMDKSEAKCSDLTEQTANALTADKLYELFGMVQQNCVDVTVKAVLKSIISLDVQSHFRKIAEFGE